MRRSPSIVPHVADRDVYIVLDDFGSRGRSWREMDEGRTDRTTVLQDMIEGQYNNPVRVVAFNTAEGWSRDVSADLAHELAQIVTNEREVVPSWVENFLDLHLKARFTEPSS